MKCFPTLILTALFFGAAISRAQTLSLDYSNLPGQSVVFHGTPNTFEFSSTADRGFQITSASLAPLVGLKGSISGLFAIGAITPMVGFEQAPVTGAGVFKIFDSDVSTTPLTADLTWGSVLRVGPAGILNPDDVFNLSNFSYTGTDASLLSLATTLNSSTVLTFQFTPSKSLTQLTSDGTTSQTSYSGSVTALIPEPTTYALLMGASAFLGARLLRRRLVA